MTYIVYKKERVEQEKISIPLITKDKNEFKGKIAQIGSHLEMDLYSNNNLEHIKILQSFLKPFYPNLVFQTTELKDNNLSFKMTNEDKSLNGVLSYLPSEGQLGTYKIQILNPLTKNVEKEFDFTREYKNTLSEQYKKNGFDKLFKSIHEEILEMFQEEYANILFPQTNQQLEAS